MGTSALIIAKPGPLRDALHALIATMPQIGSVGVASDVPSALRATSQNSPGLVLLDSDLTDGEVWLTVRRTKTRWPQARSILLVSNVQQQQEAETAGADMVLLKGIPAGRLVAAIVKLLPRPVV